MGKKLLCALLITVFGCNVVNARPSLKDEGTPDPSGWDKFNNDVLLWGDPNVGTGDKALRYVADGVGVIGGVVLVKGVYNRVRYGSFFKPKEPGEGVFKKPFDTVDLADFNITLGSGVFGEALANREISFTDVNGENITILKKTYVLKKLHPNTVNDLFSAPERIVKYQNADVEAGVFPDASYKAFTVTGNDGATYLVSKFIDGEDFDPFNIDHVSLIYDLILNYKERGLIYRDYKVPGNVKIIEVDGQKRAVPVDYDNVFKFSDDEDKMSEGSKSIPIVKRKIYKDDFQSDTNQAERTFNRDYLDGLRLMKSKALNGAWKFLSKPIFSRNIDDVRNANDLMSLKRAMENEKIYYKRAYIALTDSRAAGFLEDNKITIADVEKLYNEKLAGFEHLDILLKSQAGEIAYRDRIKEENKMGNDRSARPENSADLSIAGGQDSSNKEISAKVEKEVGTFAEDPNAAKEKMKNEVEEKPSEVSDPEPVDPKVEGLDPAIEGIEP